MRSKKIYSSQPLNTAVLFLVFNRLDTTKQVFEAIKQAKPPRLYVAADGPREGHKGEKKKVKAVRDHIMNNVDWDCEVKALFREKNLGCKYAVSGAIDWFFINEEEGIILEDDCLPTQSFFRFMENTLNEYNCNKKIFLISGFNKYASIFSKNHFISNYASIWGWATWKDRWLKYDVTLFDWRRDFFETDVLNSTGSKFFTKIHKKDFDSIVENKIDTWDIQLQYALLKEKCFCVYPQKNLIRNIGFVGHHSTGRTNAHSISSFEKFNFKKVIKLRRSISFEIFKYVDFKFLILKSKIYKIFKKL